MALTISTGFVVDDAIVVIENITRYLEMGMPPLRRAEGRAGDRLHCTDHQLFAGRRVHSAAADGRNCRPAVPRIRRHAFGRDRGFHGGLADDHADDVRPSSEGVQQTTVGSTAKPSTVSIGSSNLYGRTLIGRAAPFLHHC